MDLSFKKIKTIDGVIVSYFTSPNNPNRLHSLDGPSLIYPKEMKKKNIYAIYGIEYSRADWLSLKNDSKLKGPSFNNI